jgi:hypothetical protein
MFNKINTILILLACLLQIECAVNSTEYSSSSSPDFNKQLMGYLNTFQTKLESKTLTKMDEQIIFFLLNLIIQRTKELDKEKEDRTVYWYSRQGR